MSTVFKKFSKSDISITPFNVHKQTGPIGESSWENKGISVVSASFPLTSYKSGTGFEWAGTGSADPSNHKKYFQLDHLFYKNSKLEYHNKFSTTKYFDHYRVLYEYVNIISLPYKTIGYKIKPKSVHLINGRYKDDGKGNLYDSALYNIDTLGNPTLKTSFASDAFNPTDFINENSRIFHLGPNNGFKFYNLNIQEGKELINASSSYSETALYDDSFNFNIIEYENATFLPKIASSRNGTPE